MSAALCLSSLILGAVGAFFITAFAGRLGLIDRPNNRSSHVIPTPKGGGIGILAAFLSVSIALQIPVSLWLPAFLLGLFSLFADNSDFDPKIRLLLQFVAAFILLTATKNTFPPSLLDLPLVLFFCFLMVGTANVYNFMDGINGIAGITGVVGFGLVTIYAFFNKAEPSISLLPLCLSMACCGFLPFNFPKARVFLGDVGSILLGFVFSSIVALWSKDVLDFICLCGFLFPFYADELNTMFVRVRDGQNLLHPHRRHVYQLLANEMAIAHWKVSLGYGVLQAAIGLIALLIKSLGLSPLILFLSVCFGAFSLYAFALRKRLEIISDKNRLLVGRH